MSEDWDLNYFNYFTEIEEHFQRARGTSLFLLSPLDWSLIETWKNAGIPLEAVLRGIDEAFEKWRSRKSKVRMINSLAYCAQAVVEQAQIMAGTVEKAPRAPAAPPFPLEDLRAYLSANAAAVRARPGEAAADVAAALDRLAAEAEQHFSDLEDLERRLTALEEKMIAAARAAQTEDDLLEGAPRLRLADPPLSRQDERRPDRAARKAIPRTPPARIHRAPAAESFLFAMTQSKRLLPLVLLFALAAPAADDIRSVTILHTNDLHSRLSPLENGKGGFAYVAAAIRNARENCTACLLLNAGDIAQGSPVSTIFHGLPVWEIVNHFGYDASTLGNHDFDYGWMQARRFVATAKFPVVLSNLVDDGGKLFVKRPFVVLRANGVRIAVVGAMTDDFGVLTTPALRGPWHTTPVLEAVQRAVNEARAHADLVVVLAHITPAEESTLLKLVPDAPVIITRPRA